MGGSVSVGDETRAKRVRETYGKGTTNPIEPRQRRHPFQNWQKDMLVLRGTEKQEEHRAKLPK
jgi:hypothetical protein